MRSAGFTSINRSGVFGHSDGDPAVQEAQATGSLSPKESILPTLSRNGAAARVTGNIQATLETALNGTHHTLSTPFTRAHVLYVAYPIIAISAVVVIGHSSNTQEATSTPVQTVVFTTVVAAFVVASASMFGRTVSHPSSIADIHDARYASFSIRVPHHTGCILPSMFTFTLGS